MEPTPMEIETTNDADRALTEQVKVVGEDLKELGRVAGTDAKDKVHAVQERGREMVDGLTTQAKNTISRRPFASLATAIGIGAVAGLLLGRR